MPRVRDPLDVVDIDNLGPLAPCTVCDLPLGGACVPQKVAGFRITIGAGEIVVQNGSMIAA